MDLPKNLKLIIFDFDGTLFHLDIDWGQLRQDLKLQSDQNLGDTIQQYRLNQDPALKIVTKAELQAVEGKSLDISVADTLKALKEKYSLAILTRNSRLAVKTILEKSKLKDIKIIGREDVSNMKPDPLGIIKLKKFFKNESGEVLVVGDTFHDVEAAKRAGAKSMIVLNSKLKNSPAGADFYIKEIKELRIILMIN